MGKNLVKNIYSYLFKPSGNSSKSSYEYLLSDILRSNLPLAATNEAAQKIVISCSFLMATAVEIDKNFKDSLFLNRIAMFSASLNLLLSIYFLTKSFS